MNTIFTYGTLRRNCSAYSLMRRNAAAFVREAVTAPRYKLYDMGAFPGLVESDSEQGGVHGEVFTVPDAAFRELDAYECVSGGLFRRGEVELDDGTIALAYFINIPVDDAVVVESGVWQR